jgi:hypothetical protein
MMNRVYFSFSGATYFAVACLTALVVANSASAATMVTTATGSGADTFLSNDGQNAASAPTTVHGADTSMTLRNLPATRARLPMVRFDISTLTGTGAKLTVTVSSDDTGGTQPFTLYGLNDGNAGENWDEVATSYSNAPGVDNSAALGDYVLDAAQVTSLLSVDVDGSQTAPYDVTFSGAALDAFLAADSDNLVTFFISNDNGSGKTYTMMTKEDSAATPPSLMTVPEPASFTLAVAMVMGMLPLTRRRR